jgi:hypothetical protein
MSRHRRQKLMKNYGMTEGDYNAILTKQEGKCAICGEYAKLVVDHCHTTQKVRGLLCSPCNTGIGLLRESPVNLTKAIQYLATHTTP